MTFSLSSLFNTLLVSGVLIFLLNLVLIHKKLYLLFRVDFLCMLVCMVVLHLCLPFEFFFTKSLRSRYLMTYIQDFILLEIYGYPLYQILFLIWGIGIVIYLVKYIRKILWINRFYKKIIQNAQCFSIEDLLEKTIDSNANVYVSKLVSSPMVLGFHKSILLPDIEFDQSELENILYHELQHIKNHDILIKHMLNLLSIVYWWFPPMKKLAKNIGLILEIRVDSKVVDFSDKEKLFGYTHTLIDVQKKLTMLSIPNWKKNAACLIDDQISVLEYRINYLLKEEIKRKTKFIIVIFLVCLPFLSNSIMLEPYYYDNMMEKGYGYTTEYIIENCELIHHKDGTYGLLMNGKEGSLIDPSGFIAQGIKVKEE
ncbi:hypothetical protein C815_01846 [Firmicutes bacterium M10-2]|nr:hypothetical protein C815_01846 [Firmicutes bacterium M10-2]